MLIKSFDYKLQLFITFKNDTQIFYLEREKKYFHNKYYKNIIFIKTK